MRYDGPDTEIKQIVGGTPQGKNANVKRLLKRLLMAATEETGDRKIIGFFCVTITADKGAGLAYALTADEAPIAAQAAEAGMERALQVIRAAAIKKPDA